ncbi:hypothetical protein HELRODRAFT_156123 [Helobdella robusta]|uniref:Uncharacterized protein n=1 Tax=Helobdella robusta TaxID=6412 RepID=T1ELR8_HELRO|nr:hypothetical protein HELRODRAFT_156123 [Helobdella robusta]ESN91534.1 hypothetical protein HELRODRAFT_156123 [Helobdella robusta]
MDPFFLAVSNFRRRKFVHCVDICTDILKKNPYDQATWALKMQGLTEQVYVDEIDMEDESMADILMDDNAIANVSRPGTSLKRPNSQMGTSQGVRPMTNSGRPVTGFVRPGTQSGKSNSLDQALKTPRTARTARPVSSATSRFVRLGTASMLTSADGPFINLSRLDFQKYASKLNVSKSLFEYIFHHENDVKNALELASLATKASSFKDWWWKVQIGKCYHRLGLYRDAERQFQSALTSQPIIDTYLYLAKVYIKIDQPLSALQTLKLGLEVYSNDLSLLIGQARIFEGLNENEKSLACYKAVLNEDNMCVEAIACIGTNHFYSDQPEIALKFFRRLLQMGVCNAEIYNNIGLCCFHAQQYDITVTCFQRALLLSDSQSSGDVWYNIGHVALSIGDLNLASRCFHLSLAENNDHAESYNNLGVIEFMKGHTELSKAFLQASFNLSSAHFEPYYNYALLANKLGDLQTSYNSIRKSLQISSCHNESISLHKSLQHHFIMI